MQTLKKVFICLVVIALLGSQVVIAFTPTADINLGMIVEIEHEMEKLEEVKFDWVYEFKSLLISSNFPPVPSWGWLEVFPSAICLPTFVPPPELG